MSNGIQIDLTGRTALVSGSTQGIGAAIAVELARAGATVVVNGRDEQRTEAAAAAVREQVGPGTGEVRVHALAADLATAEGAELAHQAHPDVDVLVNNLGIFGTADPLSIDDDEWRRYFEVNVLSAVRLIRTYLPGMTARGWGRVVSIASDSAVVTPVEMIHYGVTKTALLAVTRGFAKAAKGTGVTVNSVIVGPTHTPGVEEFARELVGDLPWDEAEARFMAEHRPQSLLQRLIEPAEIGRLVAYLSSDLASATTGGAVRADGGYVDSILP
jgi:NAD(P)-dependent dehydrogenase (short-subunit alcohol dehydrogenase family)